MTMISCLLQSRNILAITSISMYVKLKLFGRFIHAYFVRQKEIVKHFDSDIVDEIFKTEALHSNWNVSQQTHSLSRILLILILCLRNQLKLFAVCIISVEWSSFECTRTYNVSLFDINGQFWHCHECIQWSYRTAVDCYTASKSLHCSCWGQCCQWCLQSKPIRKYTTDACCFTGTITCYWFDQVT
jgi:hypothetical protein